MKINVKALLGVVILVVIIWFYFGGGLEQQASKQMETIQNKVALDSEKEYEIAKRNGDLMEIYVHAGLVAAAYLQAKDEVNYKKWKEIEKTDAEAAGISAP